MTPERKNKLLTVLSKRQSNLTVVLENVFDPHNISAVMRTCDSVGIQDVYILNTKIPPHKEWGFKSSSSARKWVTSHQFTNAADCFGALRKNYTTVLTTHLGDNSIGLYDIDFTGSVALVFGNETYGVSEDIMAMADGNFVIPQVGIIRSLNISVACAVSIYEAYRQKKQAGQYDQMSLPSLQQNQLMTEWGFKDQEIETEEN
jgi:tRNA (guanosine-2'-O-)-methyltransferase